MEISKSAQERKEFCIKVLRHTFVPLTNNEAERSLRPLRVKQKISGTCLSLEKANENVNIMSFIATAKKHDQNVLAAILKMFINPEGFILV